MKVFLRIRIPPHYYTNFIERFDIIFLRLYFVIQRKEQPIPAQKLNE